MCTTATRMTNFHHKRLRELGNLGRAARRGSQSLSATTCITHESPSEIFLTRLSSVAIHTYTYTYTLTYIFSHSLSLSLSLSLSFFLILSHLHALSHIYTRISYVYAHVHSRKERDIYHQKEHTRTTSYTYSTPAESSLFRSTITVVRPFTPSRSVGRSLLGRRSAVATPECSRVVQRRHRYASTTSGPQTRQCGVILASPWTSPSSSSLR